MTCGLCCILATFILIAVMLLVDWQRRLLAMTNVRKICLMLVASKKAFGVNREAYGATADIGAGGSTERASRVLLTKNARWQTAWRRRNTSDIHTRPSFCPTVVRCRTCLPAEGLCPHPSRSIMERRVSRNSSPCRLHFATPLNC